MPPATIPAIATPASRLCTLDRRGLQADWISMTPTVSPSTTRRAGSRRCTCAR